MKDSTGISVDTTTSVISASNSWWQEREPQFSVNQRREQLRNDGLDNDEGHVYFETYDGDMQDSQVPETQENEEVYRVNIDDETRQSNAFIRESLHQNSSPAAPFQIPTSRIQQRGGVRRGSSSQRDTITGFREFQSQSLQQLRPNFFDEAYYSEFDMAVKIFESMDLPNDTDFYWACMHAFKEERFWRKYFIDRAERTIEDKLKFLQALTGYTRDSEYVGKRLASEQNFGSPIGSGFSFGSPSFGGNYSLGQSSGSQWGPDIQQWGTPPTAPQWNSPSNVPQWGMPPTAPQWGPPPNMPQWSSPPTAPQWNSPSNTPQ
ncbi:hypothetical protein ISN44_As12g033370 [Arabidopsis suecica]|uniref:Uncharacterized protein n=1 Tax=Arabidopsis suecica TaxID=45249 RepID=A0A8T1YQ43_ARASU|nr:hypothetical protein ISN44_As12g033370 [Arabidopsis suecica]